MADWIAKTSDAAKATWNVIRSVGPFVISQSEAISDEYARHQLKLASVEAGKELLIRETHTLGQIRKKLLARYADSGPEHRVLTRRDIAEVDASLRHVRVGEKALNYLPALSAKSAAPSRAETEISPHWMGKFSEFARAPNEPWREDLLARALATESSTPGTVPSRTLWLLGTIDENAFTAVATILDLCSFVAVGPMIPNNQPFNHKPIPNCKLGDDISIQHLVHKLRELGLIADPIKPSRKLGKDNVHMTHYGAKRLTITCLDNDLPIQGVILTGLGLSIATFYEPKTNPLGAKIFETWIASLDESKFLVHAEAE
jgi:hypothetical protein